MLPIRPFIYLGFMALLGCTPRVARSLPLGGNISARFAPVVLPVTQPRVLRLGPVMLPDVLDLAESLQEAMASREPSVTIVIDSPGGSVDTGLALVGMLKAARAQGMSVHCRVDGTAASMAAVILEAGCTTRTMTPGSALLFHEPSIRELGGTEHDLRRLADKLADVNRRIAILIAPRLGLTARQYEAWVRERDRWMDADESLEKGAVDAVVPG